MSLWVVILASGWFAICLFKAVQLGFVLDNRLRQTIAKPPVLSKENRPTSDEWPRVEIIIPARNEPIYLTPCLDAVLTQDYPHFSVCVVDDRSDDETGAIAQRYAASDNRVGVMRIEELPGGWQGKSHAMWHAAQRSNADWLLFIDADVTLDPWALRAAIMEAQRTGAELLTLWPRMNCLGFWQVAVMPLCALELAQWFSPQLVNHPNTNIGYVNGQFVLVRRATYFRIDGHRAVRECIIDDATFGMHAKKRGVPLRLTMGTNVAEVRMFDDNAAMFRGWARIFSGSLRSPWKPALSVLSLLCSAWPLIAAPLLAALWIGGLRATTSGGVPGLPNHSEWLVLVVLCCVHFVLFNLVNWQIAVIGRTPLRWLWFYPLAIVAVIAIMSYSCFQLATRCTLTWRGTQYQINRSGAIVATGSS